MNQVATRQAGSAPATAQASESGKTLAMVLEAARDPSIDAAKTEQMVNLALKLQDRERETEFNQSLVAAQLEMPIITRDGVITIPAKDGKPARTQGRFARYEDIDRVIRPILARHNMALRFEIGNQEQSAVTVTPILTHTNGYTLRGQAMKLPADTSGSKNSTQAVGSAVQYGKRYSASALLNIVTEGIDDDGNLGQTVTHLPYEREQIVLAEAAQACAEGCYQAWFDRQSPKDRAYMITSGKHAEYGGKALPAPEPKPKPAQATEPRTSANTSSEPPPSKPAKKSARQWVDEFKGFVDGESKLDALDQFWDEMRDSLAQLKAKDPALWQEAHDHISKKRDSLAEGRLV